MESVYDATGNRIQVMEKIEELTAIPSSSASNFLSSLGRLTSRRARLRVECHLLRRGREPISRRACFITLVPYTSGVGFDENSSEDADDL